MITNAQPEKKKRKKKKTKCMNTQVVSKKQAKELNMPSVIAFHLIIDLTVSGSEFPLILEPYETINGPGSSPDPPKFKSNNTIFRLPSSSNRQSRTHV